MRFLTLYPNLVMQSAIAALGGRQRRRRRIGDSERLPLVLRDNIDEGLRRLLV